MSQRFSSRTAWDLGESAYARAVREARASARKLYDLTVSNPTRCGFTYPEDILAPLASTGSLTYDPDPRGLLTAREAVSHYYADHHVEVSPDNILLTTSTSESYSFLFRLLCDPGDEVLVAQPSYPLFDFLSDLDDVRLCPYPLFYDSGWYIDFAELQRSISPRTRAIVIVHPNNPTGHWTHRAEREQIEQICARHNLALIVDEVFLDYPLSLPGKNMPPPPGSFACGTHPGLTFVLSGLSKVAGLPQMKAAWLVALGPETSRAEASSRLEVIADTFLSMSAPVQLALPEWIAGRSAIQGQILDRIRTNIGMLAQLAAVEPGRLRLLNAEAGWSAVLSLPNCVGEVECAVRLIREWGVIVHPGSFYGLPGLSQIVISLIGPKDDLEAAFAQPWARVFKLKTSSFR